MLVVVLVVVGLLRALDGEDGVPRSDAPPPDLPGRALKALAAERGVGTAVRAAPLARQRPYRELVAAQFSSVTPENEMKWNVTEPEQGEFAFEAADAITRFARERGLAVRGHTLVWHNQLPTWVYGLVGNELRAALRKHVQTVARHFRGQVAAWDVANEVVDDRGRLRRSHFFDQLGRGYIGDAFRWAREADPEARLYINDYGIEGIGPKSDRLYELVRDLKADGVPVDGVGFQTHVNLRGVPDSFAANLRRFAALGVEVAITEADVAVRLPATARELRDQAAVFAELTRACRAQPACRSLTFWGFTDAHSWIGETRPGFGAATLLDGAYAPKPAFAAVQDALRGAGRGGEGR